MSNDDKVIPFPSAPRLRLTDAGGRAMPRTPSRLEEETQALLTTLLATRAAYDADVPIKVDLLRHLLQAYFAHDLIFNILETGEINDEFVAEQPIRVQNVVAEIKRQAPKRMPWMAPTPPKEGT